MTKTKHIAPTVTALALLVVVLILTRVASIHVHGPASTSWRPLVLLPGEAVSIASNGLAIQVRIPKSPTESASCGTFRVTMPGLQFDSGELERDGNLESVFIDDVNKDSETDAVIIVRSAGSGSYVTIYCILSGPNGYSANLLPEPPSALMPDYQGHDIVTVNEGVISRTYPAYVNTTTLRLDRQWAPQDLVIRGTGPLKSTPDSNADPSGREVRVSYSISSGLWR